MQNLTHLYEYGYISMFGHTVGCSDCKSDLISETFIPTSDYSPIQNWEKISNRSRKSINKFLYGNRTPQKMYRRAKMLTISNYISQIKNSNSTLSESEIIKLSDAFNEVNEMILRANECVSADQLKTFIDKKMVPSLNNASARFERVKDALWSMRTEFIDLWEGAKSQLKGINSEIRKEFIQIENEALEMANEIKGEMKEIETKIPKRKKSSFPMFLFCLCVIEFVAYFVFLLKNYSKITTKKIL
ncbi:Legume-like lectin family protein [Histomonas meleagridis]|uniref:Legume-like lectin family protein n=1 Tax=Histomonas meleagridis TaxID=135588 RepID=UPI0035596980|nr:Legume-like lectin family protein [Histomonas meleagridis]KAH0798142.1 Legume-like lectin family protein [Histomonas meleagridis]